MHACEIAKLANIDLKNLRPPATKRDRMFLQFLRELVHHLGKSAAIATIAARVVGFRWILFPSREFTSAEAWHDLTQIIDRQFPTPATPPRARTDDHPVCGRARHQFPRQSRSSSGDNIPRLRVVARYARDRSHRPEDGSDYSHRRRANLR